MISVLCKSILTQPVWRKAQIYCHKKTNPSKLKFCTSHERVSCSAKITGKRARANSGLMVWHSFLISLSLSSLSRRSQKSLAFRARDDQRLASIAVVPRAKAVTRLDDSSSHNIEAENMMCKQESHCSKTSAEFDQGSVTWTRSPMFFMGFKSETRGSG